jgi:beta-1,4-mannosyltransferase
MQLFALLWMLLVSLPRPDVILLQLPPALPTMVACWAAARRHRARLVFDWHNFAYTLMGLTLGRGHPIVRAAERYERHWGKKADAGLCVTRAMLAELERGGGVPATVFYDRPPDFFRPATLQEKHELLMRLESTIKEGMHEGDWAAAAAAALPPGQTLCTAQGPGGKVSLRLNRPALVVTSTSWTPDEDFGLLLAAAEEYEVAAAAAGVALPRLLIFVTGRGPQRAEFEARMRALPLHHVAFRTAWLETGDYPLLLGSADLGVSLHSSSSGLDLPMKVVDMFGAGLPVAALSYSCIDELVAHGRNGLLFSGARDLAAALAEALAEFGGPEGSEILARLRRGVEGSSMARWHDSWVKVALPVIAPQGSGDGGGGPDKVPERRSRRRRVN